MRVLMIGCGKMGSALLKRWSDTVDADFTVVDRKLQDPLPGTSLVRSHQELEGAGHFDVLVVAVKPQGVSEVAPHYSGFLRKGGVLVSIAAGLSAARLEDLFHCPRVIRLMPNLPVEVGAGVSGLFATPACDEDQRLFVEGLASATGYALWLGSEDKIDRVTAVAGSGPGYVFEIARVYVEAARALGFAEAEARTIVLQTILGSVELALRTDTPLSELRNNVMSRRGTTEAGIEALTRDGLLQQLVADATQAAYARAVELR